jgi:hypothetical protein
MCTTDPPPALIAVPVPQALLLLTGALTEPRRDKDAPGMHVQRANFWLRMR